MSFPATTDYPIGMGHPSLGVSMVMAHNPQARRKILYPERYFWIHCIHVKKRSEGANPNHGRTEAAP